ncbi:phage tail protein [Anaerococcus sp. AGMB00486]|uniref:Phage tail protein n=2 Tax=Anaerococcus TaxID=165779 RepID=A0ABX2N818_9FIRM|nr:MULTISPECIES: phage tail spike protein [Anaerococcus]MSS77375.1 hypothetical protein [Anaerococcus porci]NVF10824.1 phage tail protein [Anaerococcus faecalis]
MLVYENKTKNRSFFSFFKHLKIKSEINELDRLIFEIPKEYRYLFNVEAYVLENKQYYDIKNIEPYYDGYKVECEQKILEFKEKFNKSINFSYKTIEDVLKAIVVSLGYTYKIIGKIDKKRVITGDHKSSWEIFREAIKKYGVEYRVDNYNKVITIAEKLGNDKGAYFIDDFNIDDKDISVESFDFATRIIPEGMNGLKINQINDGKDYIEDKSYSDRTITYYWKDKRYTNIENLKKDAEEKLKQLARPKIDIKLKVKDLSSAIDVYAIDYDVGDLVYLIDKDRKTKERFRVVSIIKRPYKPFENEISLTNKPVDLIDDKEKIIELTDKMWEETRGRFETTDKSIEASVATAKRYTEDSFKIYKSEREQTDSKIYEVIKETTTYIDPETGQTKPIVNRQLEIDKSLNGINISIEAQGKINNKFTEEIKDRLSKDEILNDEEIIKVLKGKDGKDGLPGKQGTPGRDGKDGMPGKAGADGRTSYMHFAYADSQDGAVGFTLTATNGKKYIGFYTDFEKADSINPSKYEWSKYVGDDGKPGKDGSQGIPGKAGADGKTPYFHTAWANNSTGTSGFSTSQAGDKAYIGTYTDYIKSDSTDPSKYTWQLVKGNKGDKGEAGKQGIPGRDGESSIYTWNMLRNSRNFTKLTAYKDCTYKILDNKYKISNTNINDGIHVTTSGGDSLLKVYLGFSNDDVDELIAGEKYTFSLYVLNLSNQSFFLRINGFLFERYEIISGYSGRISISGVYLKDLVPQIQFQASNKDDRLDLVYAELKVEPGEIKNTSWTPHKTEINGKDGKDGKTGKIGQNLLRKSNVPIVDNVNYVGGTWKLCESLKDDELVTFTCKIKTQKRDGFNLYNSGGSIILKGKYIYPSDDYIIESFTFPWKTFADVSWGAKHYEQTNPPYINLYVWSNGNGTDKNNNKVSIEWAVLSRGDIPAIEWSPCYKDLEDIVSVSQEEIERELIKVKADFKIENDKIKANVESLSVGTIKEFGKLRDDFDKSINDAKNKVYLGTKEFVEKNFTSKEQTDRQIANIAEQIKVTVGERFDSLQTTIIQNKTSIKQLSDSINLTVSSVRKDIDTNKNDIRQRVKKSELISEINLTPGTALIRADKIRFEGANIDVQGTFSTLNGSNQVGVYINYNQIQFRDNRWNGKTFGMISVSKFINHSGMDLNIGHYATGSLGIAYFENDLWHNYITFDRWGLSPDKVYNDSSIIFNENASMQYNALRFGKMEILASSSNVLKIKHIDKKLGYLFYFGDNETNFYYYYAADNKDHLQPVSWDSPKGETL